MKLKDITEWSERLVNPFRQGDANAAVRKRYALRVIRPSLVNVQYQDVRLYVSTIR